MHCEGDTFGPQVCTMSLAAAHGPSSEVAARKRVSFPTSTTNLTHAHWRRNTFRRRMRQTVGRLPFSMLEIRVAGLEPLSKQSWESATGYQPYEHRRTLPSQE
jgi:hypothetical protein